MTQVTAKQKKSSLATGRDSMCQSGWVSSEMSSESDKTTLWRLLLLGSLLFLLHLPFSSAKMSREKFMSVITRHQKPLFWFFGKPVKFQSSLSKVFASLWLSTAGTLMRAGLPGNREAYAHKRTAALWCLSKKTNPPPKKDTKSQSLTLLNKALSSAAIKTHILHDIYKSVNKMTSFLPQSEYPTLRQEE